AKISKDSKIELERALKLLSEKDIDSYKKDESKVIKEAAEMIEGYSESEIAAMIRDAKKREEFERGYQRELDRKEARAEGLAEGKTQGLAEGLAEGRTQGLAEGRTQGLAEGRTQGLAEGRTQGLAEGRTQGLTEGRVEGAKQNLESNIKIMYSNGFDIDTIAKALSLDINYVKEVLNK
ncbi:MAG: hypothetical protein IKP77_06635, partial [Acholeplasmatales bacterium]|nr:hypothetical protein [Acholeplasmatales bacterium]